MLIKHIAYDSSVIRTNYYSVLTALCEVILYSDMLFVPFVLRVMQSSSDE